MDEKKYTDARYPEKINDLIDNEGKISEAAMEGAMGDFATKEYVDQVVNGLLEEEF